MKSFVPVKLAALVALSLIPILGCDGSSDGPAAGGTNINRAQKLPDQPEGKFTATKEPSAVSPLLCDPKRKYPSIDPALRPGLKYQFRTESSNQTATTKAMVETVIESVGTTQIVSKFRVLKAEGIPVAAGTVFTNTCTVTASDTSPQVKCETAPKLADAGAKTEYCYVNSTGDRPSETQYTEGQFRMANGRVVSAVFQETITEGPIQCSAPGSQTRVTRGQGRSRSVSIESADVIATSFGGCVTSTELFTYYVMENDKGEVLETYRQEFIEAPQR